MNTFNFIAPPFPFPNLCDRIDKSQNECREFHWITKVQGQSSNGELDKAIKEEIEEEMLHMNQYWAEYFANAEARRAEKQKRKYHVDKNDSASDKLLCLSLDRSGIIAGTVKAKTRKQLKKNARKRPPRPTPISNLPTESTPNQPVIMDEDDTSNDNPIEQKVWCDTK